MQKIIRGINHGFRRYINQRNRAKLTNTGLSVLSSNCVGSLILHDLGLPFRSPFVNLYLTPQDFIRYLQNIPHYQQAQLHFMENTPYPLAQLDDIQIHFLHYASAQQAQQKWQQRSLRIQFDNLFIMMTDRDGCRYEDLLAFEALPFKHKVVFTHKPYPQLSCAFYIKGFEQHQQVGDLFSYSGLLGQKYYDQFDYVHWFNQYNEVEKATKTPDFFDKKA